MYLKSNSRCPVNWH